MKAMRVTGILIVIVSLFLFASIHPVSNGREVLMHLSVDGYLALGFISLGLGILLIIFTSKGCHYNPDIQYREWQCIECHEGPCRIICSHEQLPTDGCPFGRDTTTQWTVTLKGLL